MEGDNHMAKVNGAQSVETIPGRKIVLSAGVGKTNIEELKWLCIQVLSEYSMHEESEQLIEDIR